MAMTLNFTRINPVNPPSLKVPFKNAFLANNVLSVAPP
jgi:hypothetical protein